MPAFLRFFLPGLLIIFGTVLSGCSGSGEFESDLGIEDAPAWVNQGTQAVSDEDKGRRILGVGMAPPMSELSLQKATADNRARAEVARVLSTFMQSSIADYTASGGQYSSLDADREITSSSQALLNGVQILASWKNPETGDIYSIAGLDLEQLERSIATGERVNQEFRHYFSHHSDASFDRFVVESEAAEHEVSSTTTEITE